MSECPNQMQQEHIADIASMKTDIKNLKNQYNDLSDIKDAVIETKTYIKILTESQKEQAETQKEQSVMLSQITQTIVKQNETISKQNETLERLNNKIDATDKKIDDTDGKIEELKKEFKDSESKNLIDVRDINKEDTMTWMQKNKVSVFTIGGVSLFEIGKYVVENIDNIKKIFGN